MAAKLRTKKTQVGAIKDPHVARILQRMQESQADLARQIEKLTISGVPGPIGPRGATGPAGAAGSGGGLPGFDPATLNPNLWLKADGDIFSDAGVTPAVNGDLIYQANDHSGNALHFSQADAAKRLLYYNPPSGAGMPAMLCIDDTRYLQRADDTGLTPSPVSILAAVSCADDESGSRDIYSQYHQPTDKGYAIGLVDASRGFVRVTGNANSVLKKDPWKVTGRVDRIGATIVNGGARSLWFNGVKIASDAGAAMTYDGGIPTVGWLGYLGTAYNWVGCIFEIIIVAGELSDDQMTDGFGYLTRWDAASKGLP